GMMDFLALKNYLILATTQDLGLANQTVYDAGIKLKDYLLDLAPVLAATTDAEIFKKDRQVEIPTPNRSLPIVRMTFDQLKTPIGVFAVPESKRTEIIVKGQYGMNPFSLIYSQTIVLEDQKTAHTPMIKIIGGKFSELFIIASVDS